MVRKLILISSLVFILVPTIVLAQRGYEDRLRLDISPYAWIATMNGDLTIEGERRKVNFTFEDFFRSSNLGLNGHIELKMRKWAVLFDWNYVELLNDLTTTELTLSEFGLGYRAFGDIEILLGGRYFKSEFVSRDDPDDIKKSKKSWTDPFLGARTDIEITKTLFFTIRGDLGGFGIGSDFAWNMMAGVGYRLANISFIAAYRIWYAKYETGSGDDQFVYDMTTSGPRLAMVIHF